MKKNLLTAIAAISMLVSVAEGQSTLEVSNLGQSSTGSVNVASDAWTAELFKTGNNAGGYDLNSVQLLIDSSSGNPNGFDISIYNLSNSSFEPGNSFGILNGPDPSTAGVFTYTTSGVPLAADTFYWIVATSATPAATGSYYWSLAGNFTYSSNGGWVVGSYSQSSDGASWQEIRSNPLQFDLYASAVPEPSTYALWALGALLLGFFRRHHA